MSANRFGQRLAALRRQKGISQQKLAEKTGLTPRTISFYEIEDNLGFVDKIVRIADALGVSPTELFNFSDDKPTKTTGPAGFDPRTFNKIKKILQLNPIDRAKVYEQIELLLGKDEYQNAR